MYFLLFAPTVVLVSAELARCRRDLLSRGISLNSRRSDLAEESESCRNRRALYSNQLVSAMNTGTSNILRHHGLLSLVFCCFYMCSSGNLDKRFDFECALM